MSDTPRTDAIEKRAEGLIPAYALDELTKLEREFAFVTEQRDRLADFARDVAATSSSTRLRRLAKQALAAVKGGGDE